MGYVQLAPPPKTPPPETPNIYQVTPKGKVTEVHRCRAWWAARKPRRRTLSPMPEDIGPNFEDLDVSWLDLSPWTFTALKRNRILTVGDLIRLTPEALLELRRIGWVTLQEIEWQLDTIGLRLRESGPRSMKPMEPGPKPEDPLGNPQLQRPPGGIEGGGLKSLDLG